MPHTIDLNHLDQVINQVSDPRESQCELLREHLEAARAYCVGDMPREYSLTLQLAIDALDCISDRGLRHRIKETLHQLLVAQNVQKGRN